MDFTLRLLWATFECILAAGQLRVITPCFGERSGETHPKLVIEDDLI
jgi:hypothetical protein